MKSNLVFFGTEDFSLPFLKILLEEGYEMSAVVTKPDSSKGRSARLIKPAVKQLAEKASIPVLQPKELKELKPILEEMEVEAGVLAAYGRIIPDTILELFPVGIINIHPSDLPEHRGPSPIEQTILDGDKQTAVSLIKLTSTMDAGPIYAKSEIIVPEKVSKADLTNSLVLAGTMLLKNKLPLILNGRLGPTPQDESKATYTKLIHKEDGRINWSRPAGLLERQIRAYRGWPTSFTQLFNVRITILEAKVLVEEGSPGEHFVLGNGSLGVYCGQGALEITNLQPSGKKPMPSADFLRGYAV